MEKNSKKVLLKYCLAAHVTEMLIITVNRVHCRGTTYDVDLVLGLNKTRLYFG